MRVAPIPHVNLSDKTYELLKDMIVRWELRPGRRLIDAELAQQFGVSRSLVRNALTALANDGLVKVSRRGFYVMEFTQKNIRDLLEFRRLLETSSLRAAVENTSDAEIAEMEARLGEAEALFANGDIEKFYTLDVGTHGVIIDKGGNNYIKKVYGNLATILGMIIRSDFANRRKITESFQEHKAIFDAWKRRDVQGAMEALDHHLSRAEARVMENFVQNLAISQDSSGERTDPADDPQPAAEFRVVETESRLLGR